MNSANDLLRVLVRRFPHPVCIDELAPYLPKTPERQRILQAVGTLLNRKLAVRHPVLRSPAHYVATDAGAAFVAAGQTVTSGPIGPHSGVRKRQEGTLRELLWRALRLQRKATIPGLLEIAMPSGMDPIKATHNAQRYLKALCRAGIVVELEVKEAGFSDHSRGFKRFALVRDLGSAAPQVSFTHGFVFDANKRERMYFDTPKEEQAA